VDVGGRTVSTQLSIQIDPYRVLGVSPGASLHEIREAYRRKAKQHHPDTGGEEWAFRILVQSYEVLSTARVVQATQAEYRTRPTASDPADAARRDATTAQHGPHPEQGPSSSGHFGAGAKVRSESVRPGVHDASDDPARIVDVEQLWVRFEVDHLWLLQDGGREDRFLSCSLNLSWPEPELASRATAIPDAEAILASLTEVFERIHIETPVVNSRCKVEDGKFQGWLSYPNTHLAWGAFNRLHKDLNARGLGVKQWTRDLIVPREWR
jgi:hypothetical protein